ncbi:MAG: Nif3-like dinuclear metal center hexameric protein [Rhodococcus sp.]|nr:Nif3-like dinuclear metal center hexameric protein [Rhodococcus sp. (in: high G+C Gram-positive bacteria)]
MSVRLSDVIDVLDEAYPPALAESWDSVGLVCGDPADEVSNVVVAVDATEAVVNDAIATGADLLVVHHPLLMRGVDTVAADTPKGALIHRLIKAGCALFTAHTNADSADPGVSDALAAAIGMRVHGPIAPKTADAVDKWVVLVPETDVQPLQQALFDVGAGSIGNYSECSWQVVGTGQFLPTAGATPTLGQVGDLERVTEARIEVIAPQRLRSRVLAALRAAHPYEEPAFDIFEPVALPTTQGLGRVGELEQTLSLREFTAVVAQGLPSTEWGVRSAGDPDRPVRTVAVCGGAGDSYLETVTRLGVDAYVTADLRHHPADEHLRCGGPALVDVAHWASEWPWCAQAAAIMDAAFAAQPGWTTRVSTLRTDPWTTSAH